MYELAVGRVVKRTFGPFAVCLSDFRFVAAIVLGTVDKVWAAKKHGCT